MGKDFQLRHARLIVDGYDLSGDSRTIGALENSEEGADVSGWSEHYNYMRDGVLVTGLTGYQAILNDTAGRAFAKLKTAPSHDLAFLFGTGGAPAIGDIAYAMKAQQFGDTAGFDAKVGVLQADFKPLDAYPFRPFGRALAVGAAITTTTTYASINNGAATTRGWAIQLHILATASGNYAFKLEDSANGSDWADLTSAAFTLNGSAIASETIYSATGTVRQYVRLSATRTAGGCSPVCVLSRN